MSITGCRYAFKDCRDRARPLIGGFRFVRAYTLIELMLVLVIAAVLIAIGASVFSRRNRNTTIYREARAFQLEMQRAINRALQSVCPLRVIPCRNSRCEPGSDASFPIIGYAIQVFCQTADATCNLNCANDGYDNWDFERAPHLLDPMVRIYGGQTFIPNRNDLITAGLVFPTSVRTDVLFNGAGQGMSFVFGAADADPVGNSENPGFSVDIDASGNVTLRNCAGGTNPCR